MEDARRFGGAPAPGRRIRQLAVQDTLGKVLGKVVNSKGTH
jgi:hypothetical protein